MLNETLQCAPCLGGDMQETVENYTILFFTTFDNPTGEGMNYSTVDFSHTDVPQYTVQGIWWLVWLMGLEYLALWWEGAPRLPPLHDNILSLAHATLYEVSKVFVRGLEYGVYIWVWDKYALFPSPGTSLLSLLFVVVVIDFGYYWFHRASHEIMLFWAIHQVHHTSEEFTVTIGLRHSPLQRLFSWVFYLPMALLGIPPTLMLAHIQFNTLFQCWTHTEAIRTVGPLEYVFNTPAHHRIHHGCNLHYLDKNYGGIFIIWDRLFGTFQSEIPGEEIVYGIIFQPEFFNPVYHQVFYLIGAFKKALSKSSWQESISALIKGPSWTPGSPWTGWEHEKINIKGPRAPVQPNAAPVTHAYSLLHFLVALTLTSQLVPATHGGPGEVFVYSMMVVATLTCIGILYERSPFVRMVELCRCGGCLALSLLLPTLSSTTILSTIITTIYAASLVLWVLVPQRIISCKLD